MMPYGNDYTRLTGIIRRVHEKQAHIEFPHLGKEICIPSFFIHSPINTNIKGEQDIEIETWFLKRNRIIPIG